MDRNYRRLPSLVALRTFEAVGRLLSFTKAARELGVTQAAVSRQIKNLESDLGIRLIKRGPAKHRLTSAGRVLFETMFHSLEEIATVVENIAGRRDKTVLTVSVAPFFSACWLTPRIMSFLNDHPEIDLRLHHSYAPPDYRRENIDAGINWGAGDWSDIEVVKILDGKLTPVCSPEYYGDGTRLRKPADLRGHTLLYEFAPADWLVWFAQAGVSPPESLSTIQLDDSHALRRAALDAHGVALFFRNLVDEDLRTGKLVQPFNVCADTGKHYFFNYPAALELPPKIEQLRHWLLAESHRKPSL